MRCPSGGIWLDSWTTSALCLDQHTELALPEDGRLALALILLKSLSYFGMASSRMSRSSPSVMVEELCVLTLPLLST